MPASNAEERALIASLAANSRWATETDRSGATEAARTAFQDRFLRQVDPTGEMDAETRVKAAENARRAFYTRMALKSAQARRARKSSQPNRRAS